MLHPRVSSWRRSGALFGLGLTMAGGPLCAAPQSVAEVAKSIVQVRVLNQTRRVATGSAVAVDAGVLVTSCHGLKQIRAIQILAPGQSPTVTGVVRDVEHDLCALLVSEPVAPIELARDAPPLRVGDHVAAVRYVGAEVQASEGRVVALHPYDGGSVIQTSAAFATGDSGGALINAQGELVGVLTFFTPGRGDAYFAVPVRWLRDLLAHVKDGTAPESQPEQAFWERGDQHRPAFLSAAARQYADDWDGLRELALRWSEQEPANPQAWIALGVAHYKAGQAPEAIGALERAVAIDPRLGTAWYYLGAAYRLDNQTQGVQQAIERLEALDPAAAQALRAGTAPQ